MGCDSLFQLLEDTEFDENLFSIFDNLESSGSVQFNNVPPSTPSQEAFINQDIVTKLVSDQSSTTTTTTTTTTGYQDSENDKIEASPSQRSKQMCPSFDHDQNGGGQSKTMHITVERNRRKQMNEHLSVLRNLMPKFYVKRRDQASIIGGVVDYIKELQQLLQSLEAKKQRKVYSHEVLSPRIVPSPRPSTLSSSRKSPLSPRINFPISPRTPQSSCPYIQKFQNSYLSPATLVACTSLEPSSSSSSLENVKEPTAASSKSSVADVEVKFSGPNVLLKTMSSPVPGQALKIIAVLEALSLEILHVNINVVDDTMLNSFTIKIGIECQLSAEDLAHEIQQTFS